MAAHRYWRIRNRYNRSNQTGIGTIEMASTPGGANLCTGGTPFASGSYGGGYSPSSAFDGNINSNWFQSGAGTDRYIGYDFGSDPGGWPEINELRMGPGSEDLNGYPRMFDFQSSDDMSSFNNEWQGGGDDVAGSTIYTYPRPGPLASARYWLLEVYKITLNGNRDVLINELGLRIAGADQMGSSTLSSYRGSPNNVKDGNDGTYWYWDSAGQTPLLKIDLGSALAIDEMLIKSYSVDGFSNNARAPEDAMLYASEGGRSWTPMLELVDEPYWGGLETRTWPIGLAPSAPTRRRLIIVT